MIYIQYDEIDRLANEAFNKINNNRNISSIDKFLIELYCLSKFHSNPINFDLLGRNFTSIEKVAAIYSLLYEIRSKKLIPILAKLDDYMKKYESTSPLKRNRYINYEYKCDVFNSFDVIIHKDKDVGFVDLKIMYNDEIIEENSKFDNDVVYHIYGTNVIRIEGVLLKSKIAKYKITIAIKPTNTIDSLKVLRNNKIEDLDTYNYNDEEM